MPYQPNNLKTEAFIAGKIDLYNAVCENPHLRMVPIHQLDSVRRDLKQLGYRIRVRYRGPHWPLSDTVKARARAFTVYFDGL
jgi:hypothetical protein